MHYIFILDGSRSRAGVAESVKAMAGALPGQPDWGVFFTRRPGDAAEFVNHNCTVEPDAETCFVAVGGSSDAGEVASALIGKEHKYLAVADEDSCRIKSLLGWREAWRYSHADLPVTAFSAK